MACVNLVLTVNRDTAEPPEDLSGALSLEGPDGIRLAPFSKEIVADIAGSGAQYKNKCYQKMTVVPGQMASPPEVVNIEEPIGKLGLVLDPPVYEFESVVLGGVTVAAKQISGSVNTDAVVEIWDIEPATPKLLVTAKPDKEGEIRG